ncbi:MAG: M56 family metallopeptidase [Solirubrobacterales bacterium]
MSPERSARRLYRLHVSIAGVGGALVAGTIAFLATGADSGLPSPATVAAACDRWLFAGGPGALAALALGALALVSLGLGARSGWRQLIASRRYLAGLPVSDHRIAIGGTSCPLVETAVPNAFCAGYLRPQVYLSRGALDRLSHDELRAVVGHELHHAGRRDPLRLLLARSLADGLFFIPLLRRSSERYAALGELAADDAAVRHVEGRRPPLASALLKLSPPGARPASVLGIAPERVDHLVGEPGAGGWRLPRALAGRSALVLLGLASLLAASAHGLLVANLELPVLLTAGCMAAMIGGPLALALGMIVVSRRALRARRA